MCSCAHSACTPPLPAGVCGVGVCACARVSAAPRHSWLGCWGVCVFVCALRLYPATPGWGVRRGCVCFGLGFGCAPPLLAGLLGCVCARAPNPLVPRHSLLGWAVWVCVPVLGFRLRPASPGWGVGVCVCSCAQSACTPPLLAGVMGCVCVCVRPALVPRQFLAGMCGVGVCAWAWVSGAPRHLWLGCWGVCVFACPLRPFPTGLGWGVWCVCVCLGSGFGCAPPLLAGVLGCVCVRVPGPLVPRHSWLGCAPWVCVLWLGFWLRPATPRWRVGVCACSCARSTCTLPLLAGVCGVGVCAWARASAAPCHSWLGCWVVCVFVCALRLYPATPGLGVPCGSVCSGLGFGCAPPLLAGVYGCVCGRVPAPLVPRHSWLGCVVCVCVFGLGLRLRPATPGWGAGVCVCSCARSACTPPLLAGVCGVGVCVWARVSAAPRRSWLGCWGACASVCPLRLHPATPCWGGRCGCVCLGSGFGCAPPLLAGVSGCVCVCVRAPPVPRHSWLGSVVWVCVLGLGVRQRPATPGWGDGVCVCLHARFACTPPLLAGVCGVGVWVGCCLAPVPVPWFVACCARFPGSRHPVAVVAWHLSMCLGFGRRRASLARFVAPRWCAAPRPVRSPFGAPVSFPDAVVPFPVPGACAPGFTGRLRGARGGRPRTGLFVRAAGPCRGRGPGLAPRCTRSGPRDGVVPGGSLRRRSSAACAAMVGLCGPGN